VNIRDTWKLTGNPIHHFGLVNRVNVGNIRSKPVDYLVSHLAKGGKQTLGGARRNESRCYLEGVSGLMPALKGDQVRGMSCSGESAGDRIDINLDSTDIGAMLVDMEDVHVLEL
jgi:hypothetical protein